MPSYKNLADVFQGGATTSQHIDARDDEHFADTTFLLKRTRSLGLLDDFIIPSDSKVKDDFVTDETVNKINQKQPQLEGQPSRSSQLKLPKITIPQKKSSILYNSDSSDTGSDDDDDENKIYLPHGEIQRKEDHVPQRCSSTSPSPTVMSPEFLPHDDNDLAYEPQRHVDYLSHDWKESDISKSWRYVVLKRKDVANSARLENASWRTWAQTKNHLPTLSPLSLNWSKESDVTWLFGPLYKPSASNNDGSRKGDNTSGGKLFGVKPILKKKTTSQLLKEKLSPQHHTNRASSPISLHSPLQRTTSNSIEHHHHHHQSSDSVPTSHLSALDESSDSDSKKERHIHFNDTVEQCIAVDVISDDEYGEDDDDDVDSSDEDSDEEGGFCLNVRSPSSAFLYKQGYMGMPQPEEEPQHSEESDLYKTKSNSSQYQTIALLPSTHLNYNTTEEEVSEEDEEEKEYTSIPFYDNRVSHNVHTNRNYDYHYNYDYNSIYTNPNSSASLVKNIMNNEKNDNLKVFDIPDNLDLGSIIQIEDVDESTSITPDSKPQDLQQPPFLGKISSQENSFSSLQSNSSSSLTRSNSGYNIREQQPLPPYQSNTSVSGQTFSLGDEDSGDEGNSDNELSGRHSPSINLRLQRISSGEQVTNKTKKDIGASGGTRRWF